MFKIQKRIIYAIEAVIDIALNSGLQPVQNISIARRQKIPKRYLEQTLQVLVKKKILVGSRGPKGGYRLARERRKIKISEIINTVSNDESKEICKSELSRKVIEPMINNISSKCFKFLDEISVEEICKVAKEKKLQKYPNKKVDFVI